MESNITFKVADNRLVAIIPNYPHKGYQTKAISRVATYKEVFAAFFDKYGTPTIVAQRVLSRADHESEIYQSVYEMAQVIAEVKYKFEKGGNNE